MINISGELKEQARLALLTQRENFDGSDAAFAKQWGINQGVYSRLKKGQIDGVLADPHWLNICRELNVGATVRKWEIARTDVFNQIEEDVLFCKEHAKAMIFVDDCEIGKTVAAKYLSRNLKNCFYIDASQCKTKQQFVRKLAKTIGVDQNGKYAEVKATIKYYLKILPKPIVIVDEAGDLEYNALMELKEFWNATEGACAWYMIGADGLRAAIDRGISNKKVGYRELFSRYSNKYSSVVPQGNQAKLMFYKKLIGDVLRVNMKDTTDIDKIINKCITRKDNDVNIGGLRRAESILLLNQ